MSAETNSASMDSALDTPRKKSALLTGITGQVSTFLFDWTF